MGLIMYWCVTMTALVGKYGEVWLVFCDVAKNNYQFDTIVI